MSYLVIKHLGVPVLSITDAKLAELEAHLAAYPELREEYIAGNVTASESTEAVTLSAMPVTDAKLAEGKSLLALILDLESRVSALEGKTITATEAKDALKATLTATKEATTK